MDSQDSYYQIRILNKATDATVKIFGESREMNPLYAYGSPIFQISEGQRLTVRDLPDTESVQLYDNVLSTSFGNP